MRELEASLQQFGEFLLKARLVREKAAPYCVRWVRRFLTRPASNEPLADQVRRFCEELERAGACQDWQVRQAEHALRTYFVNFLRRTDWHRRPATAVVDDERRTNPLAALEELRRRLRTRHYSYRTECSYVDWVRRFFAYASERQAVPQPRVESDLVRDYLTHLAVRRRVSASTQNQALCAILFLCREVLAVDLEDLSQTTRAKRGSHLPVVLSVPETAALLEAMHGLPLLMAAVIYGGGLRVSECCQLRVKDLDFDQGLVFIRAARAPETGRPCWPRSAGLSCAPNFAVWRCSTARIATPASPASGCRRSASPTRSPVVNMSFQPLRFTTTLRRSSSHLDGLDVGIRIVDSDAGPVRLGRRQVPAGLGILRAERDLQSRAWSSISRNRMCAGVEPQHPPMMRTSASSSAGTPPALGRFPVNALRVSPAPGDRRSAAP